MVETQDQVEAPAASPVAPPVTAGRLMRLRDSRALAAWRSRPFRRFFWASALAMGGRTLQTTAIGYIVYDQTGSDFLLGLVSFMQMVPQLLLAPVVGVLVDRFDRRKIMAMQLGTQAFGMLVLSLLALVGVLTVPVIAGVVVVMGVAQAFSYPAQSSLLPSVVPLGALQSANALRAMMANVTSIAVPTAAGLAIDLSGIAAALLLGCGLYGPGALLIVTMPIVTSAVVLSHPRGTLEPAAGAGGFGHDIAEAVRYIRGDALVRAALFNDVVPYLFGMSTTALLPALARDTLHGGARTLGLVLSVAGSGALCGTLTAGAMAGRGHRGRMLWIGMTGYGLALLLVASGSTRQVILPAEFLVGYFQMLYIVQSDTLVQTSALDHLRGRIVSAQSMVNGLMPVGFLLLGTIAQFSSISVAFALSGVALVTAGLTTFLFRPIIRRLH